MSHIIDTTSDSSHKISDIDRSKKVQQSVYLMGEEILHYFKSQGIVPRYKSVFSSMKSGKVSSNPDGVVDYHTYSIKLHTGFLMSKKLIEIDATVGKNPTPILIFGKEFKKYERLVEYQQLIEFVLGVAGKYHIDVLGIHSGLGGGYSVVRTI